MRSAFQGIFLGTILFIQPFTLAFANFGVAISSGEGVEDITPVRFAYNWDFGRIWRCNHQWGLNAHWENSFAFWESGDPPPGTLGDDANTDLRIITTGPVFRWQRKELHPYLKIAPYIEAGIGASWLSHDTIGGRRLSIHFQFEDNIGIGARFGQRQQFDITLRGFHYSNASIKRPNSGVNIAMLSLGVWFVDDKH